MSAVHVFRSQLLNYSSFSVCGVSLTMTYSFILTFSHLTFHGREYLMVRLPIHHSTAAIFHFNCLSLVFFTYCVTVDTFFSRSTNERSFFFYPPEGPSVRPSQPRAGETSESRQCPEVPRGAYRVRHPGHSAATLPRDLRPTAVPQSSQSGSRTWVRRGLHPRPGVPTHLARYRTTSASRRRHFGHGSSG